jgi:hypothetical protein
MNTKRMETLERLTKDLENFLKPWQPIEGHVEYNSLLSALRLSLENSKVTIFYSKSRRLD